MPTNRLSQETSPYLLQHKDNPVHWLPWGDEALGRARDQDKPILLSVGYAACHWCHVMAHESFEDDAIAAIMNADFINVKVDREERPDLDAIYQSAINMLGEQGGWPLTVFLTPDGTPFWGGTYFPPTPRYGRPGFSGILKQISNLYQTDRAKIDQNATAIGNALREFGKAEQSGTLSAEQIAQAATAALTIVDPEQGGTSGAPKFPQPTFFRFLWHAYLNSNHPDLASAVTVTLDNLCQGGIYDHLAGGFSRYSVDDRWLVPHFEKMLYDNALLVELLADVWSVHPSPLYRDRIYETIAWMMRDLKTGGEESYALVSAFDADSEGVEGKYYVWSLAEVESLLGTDTALFCSFYDVTEHGNWEGANILNRRVNDTASFLPHSKVMAQCRNRLLDVRDGRVPPLRDDKVLADWNGMAIAALCRTGTLLGAPEWVAHAQTVFGFIVTNLANEERLFHTWCAGQARHPAVLDDYAHMSRAALALYQITGKPEYLASAVQWVEVANAHYWDPQSGAYFLAADDTADLIVRTKTVFDNATPSGNGTMLEVLARLYLISGDVAYRDRADALVAALAPQDPRGLLNQPSLSIGYETLSNAYQIVIATDDRNDGDAEALFDAAVRAAPPGAVISWRFPETAVPPHHPAAGKAMVDGRATAYLCQGAVCGLPVQTAAALEALFD